MQDGFGFTAHAASPRSCSNRLFTESPVDALIDLKVGCRLCRQTPVCWLDVRPVTHLRIAVIPQGWPALHLTPLELIDRIAALVPPPRTRRHRYFGVLAASSPLRVAAVAMAQPPARQAEPATTGEGAPAVVPLGHAISPTPEPAPAKRSKAHYLWAVLIARIYEVFPLLCPMCGGQMRLIAFITEGMQIRKILDHIGVDSQPPHIAQARGPPLWDDCDAQMIDGAHIEPADWGLATQAAPDFEVDQRINW